MQNPYQTDHKTKRAHKPDLPLKKPLIFRTFPTHFAAKPIIFNHFLTIFIHNPLG